MTSLILASGSSIRRQILENAGVPFSVQTSGVDEAAIKQDWRDGNVDDLALALAKAKASAIADKNDALVLGADQILSLDGKIYDKANSASEAKSRLMALRGKTHILHSGLAAYRAGRLVWTHSQQSSLIVRNFSDGFLESYMERAGAELTASVGAYAFEGVGAQLFDAIDGDYYAVLGLPLMPVLALLRREGVLPE